MQRLEKISIMVDETIIINTDGGSRGNPGPAGIGVVISEQNGKILLGLGQKIGVATNNIAEYKAVITAISQLLSHPEFLAGGKAIQFYLDSELICMQITGKYKVKNETLQLLLREVKLGLAKLPLPYKFTHVRRELNKQADGFVNRALDNTL